MEAERSVMVLDAVKVAVQYEKYKREQYIKRQYTLYCEAREAKNKLETEEKQKQQKQIRAAIKPRDKALTPHVVVTRGLHRCAKCNNTLPGGSRVWSDTRVDHVTGELRFRWFCNKCLPTPTFPAINNNNNDVVKVEV